VLNAVMRPEAKICGLTRRPDAEAAARSGAAYAGVVLAPGGKRSITPAAAAALLEGLPVRRVGVFVNAAVEELHRAAEVAGLDVLQLHGDEPPERVEAVRGAGAWRVWKAVRPRNGGEFLEAVHRYGPVVDGLLLDGWSPDARGGTGTAFPWQEVAKHRDLLPDNVVLVAAGGLGPANVGRALALLRPHVVDVSSGVERSPGAKDPEAIRAFVDAVHAFSPTGIER
jgi:phosphoribosylanthranilate isomerase